MKERLIMFAKDNNLSIRAFEDKCNWAAGTVHKINHGIRSDNLATLAEKFPNLNLRWLLLGEGNMYLKDESKKELTPEQKELTDQIFEQINLLRSLCDSYQKTINTLRTENKKLKETLSNDGK